MAKEFTQTRGFETDVPSSTYEPAKPARAKRSAGTQSGPKFVARPRDREMPAYSVSETELRHLALTEFLVSFFFGLATLCLGSAVGIWTTIQTLDKVPDKAAGIRDFDVPALIVLGAAFLVAMLVVRAMGESFLEIVRRESGVAKQPPQTLGDLWWFLTSRLTLKRAAQSTSDTSSPPTGTTP